MDKKIITFGNTEIKEKKQKIVKNVKNISKKTSSGEKNCKHFIGCLDDDYKNKQLHIMQPKTSRYIKSYVGETKWIFFFFFLTEDYKLLKKYNDIWNEVSNLIK